MSEPKDFLFSFKKIGEVAVVVATLSFVFYFIGFINKVFYLRALDVSNIFLDLSYQQYVVEGVLVLLPFFGFFFVFIDWYKILFWINETEKKLFEAKKIIIELEAKSEHEEANAEIKENKEQVGLYSDLLRQYKENFLSHNPFKLIKPINLILIVFFIIIGLIFVYYLGHKNLAILMIMYQFLLIPIINATLNQIRKFLIKRTVVSYTIIYLMMFIYIVFWPIVSGYAEGIAKNKDDFFSKINITTQDEVIVDAGLIGKGNNFYILRKNSKNLYIPESQIRMIESVK